VSRKISIVLVLATCLGLTCFGTWRFMAPRHNITRQSYEHVEKGMSEEEVAMLLGVPAGDYTTGPYMLGWHSQRVGTWRYKKAWISDEVAIHVYFGDDGVQSSECVSVGRFPNSFWDHFRSSLGL
jgi:hypothetical protein